MHIKNFDPYDFSKKEINGVPVYYKNLPWAPCINVRVVFNVGAFSDPVGKEGVAHFLEHMIGNGSPMLPDKKAIREFSKKYMLNSKNAYTSHYRTVYLCKCLPENLPKVLDAMKDYTFKSFLRAEDIEHERKVITQEAWSRYKNDKFLNYVKDLSIKLFPKHQRSRINSPLGWPETISKISQKDIKDFYDTHYTKENLSIFLTGNLEDDDIKLLDSFTDNLPTGSKSIMDYGEMVKPTISRSIKTADEIGDPHEQLEFSMSVNTKKFNEEDHEVIIQSQRLLNDLLNERLRIENSLCYHVHTGWVQTKDYQNAEISVESDEKNLEIIEKETWNVINEIIDGKWKNRFQEMHTLYLEQLKSREALSEDITEKVLGDVERYSTPRTLTKSIESAEKVTYTEVVELIKKTFDPEWVFTEVMLPSKK
jgi:predicted Zn-dependent peptidase